MHLRHFGVASTLLLALILLPAAAWAEAKSGWGVSIGSASHDAEGTFLDGSGTFRYESSGGSLGVDYQMALGSSFSLNPFYVSAFNEDTTGDLVPGTTAGHSAFGLGLRWWPGALFFGVHGARYVETLAQSGGDTISASGSGHGFSAGIESAGGWMLLARYDTFTVSYLDADVDLTGVRIHVGYRWK